MTQFQFELIVKIIEKGAPALYEELVSALDMLVKDRNRLAEIADKNADRLRNENDEDNLDNE